MSKVREIIRKEIKEIEKERNWEDFIKRNEKFEEEWKKELSMLFEKQVEAIEEQLNKIAVENIEAKYMLHREKN